MRDGERVGAAPVGGGAARSSVGKPGADGDGGGGRGMCDGLEGEGRGRERGGLGLAWLGLAMA